MLNCVLLVMRGIKNFIFAKIASSIMIFFVFYKNCGSIQVLINFLLYRIVQPFINWIFTIVNIVSWVNISLITKFGFKSTIWTKLVLEYLCLSMYIFFEPASLNKLIRNFYRHQNDLQTKVQKVTKILSCFKSFALHTPSMLSFSLFSWQLFKNYATHF